MPVQDLRPGGLIEEGEQWMHMLKDRNRTSHTYNEETAREILKNILQLYHPLFSEFRRRMGEEAQKHGIG